MKPLGKKYEPMTYHGAGHGFMRAGEAPDASAQTAKPTTKLGRAGKNSWLG